MTRQTANRLVLPSTALPLAIAYSGGADSTYLLYEAATQHPGQVCAIHIHHGLQAAADGFVQHCETTCARLGVPLHVVHVQAKHTSGDSPEDAARRARYAALAAKVLELNRPLAGVEYEQAAIKSVVNLAQPIQAIALAQHADDQVETLLLALSRGAGVAGLAGMPAAFERHGVKFVRPLLHLGAEEIRSSLKARGIAYIDDPTNADTAFTRNKIRHQLLPALAATFPQYRETFARSARNMALAGEILAQAAIDLIAIVGSPPQIAKLQSLPRASQGNVLRHWLKTQHGVAGSEAQLNELLDQIADCTNRGKNIRIKFATGFVQRQGDVLAYVLIEPSDPL